MGAFGRKRVENPKYGQCTDAEKTRPHTLYRMYDEAGTLLYIGVTGEDISQRIYMHLQTTVMVESWRIFMCYESHTTETYPNKIAARVAEREAILTEAPLFNRQHNATRWKRIRGGPVPWVYIARDGAYPVPSHRRFRVNAVAYADAAANVAEGYRDARAA